MLGRLGSDPLSLEIPQYIIIIIIIINFKLRVGFHPVAVALQNDTQIKYNTQIKHITNRIQITYTSNTQNLHIKYKYHTKYNTEKERKKETKCNKEELSPPDAAPRGPRKNQDPGGTHRPHSPGRPEPASQEPRKQPPATDTRTRSVRVSAPNNPQRHPQPANPGHPDDGGHTPPETPATTRATRRNTPEDQYSS
jgi:hypothetical protein